MSQSLTNQGTVLPVDVHNQRLVSNVHPPDWVNPKPAPRYNLLLLELALQGWSLLQVLLV